MQWAIKGREESRMTGSSLEHQKFERNKVNFADIDSEVMTFKYRCPVGSEIIGSGDHKRNSEWES